MSKHGAWSGWNDERWALCLQLWESGHSCSQIAKVLDCGISRSAVIGKLHRNGVGRDKPFLSKLMAQRIERKAVSAPRPPRVPKPKLTLVVADGEVITPPKRSAPVPDSVPTMSSSPFARPWTDRGAAECAWPITSRSETLSCCAPTKPNRRSLPYCAHHLSIMWARKAAV